MAFQYDAFISYKREDQAWADELNKRLTAMGLTIYEDTQLRGGEKWLKQLQDALEVSQHLIVLWSANAQQPAGWVAKEMFHFIYVCQPSSSTEAPRKLIMVPLDATAIPPTVSEEHARVDIQKAGGKIEDPGSVSLAVWKNLQNKLYQDIRASSSQRPVATVILATTRDYFNKNPDFETSPIGKPLHDVLTDIGITLEAGGKVDYSPFLDRYGASPKEWRPFGRDKPTAEKLLAQVETEVNQSLANMNQAPITLVPVNDDFWSSDVNKADAVMRKLANSLSLVLIDPLSLYDPSVRLRADRLRDCLQSDRTAVLMLGPNGLDKQGKAISDHVNAMSRDIYRHLFVPTLPLSARIAPSSANVADTNDIRRCLLLAVGREIPRQGAPANPYISN